MPLHFCPSSFPLEFQKLLDPLLIKTYHRLAVDERYRSALVAQGKQLFQRRLVLAHVLVDKGNTFLRKKLFLSVARASARLGKDNHGYSHTLTSRKKYRSFLYHLPLELAKPAHTRFPYGNPLLLKKTAIW